MTTIAAPRLDQGAAAAAGSQLCELVAHVSAALAELAQLVASFDAGGGWGGAGIRSCPHWLSIQAGLDLATSADLLRVGHALAEPPLLRQAFAAGQLSLDKVRALIRVASPADEEVWLELALGMRRLPARPHLPRVPPLHGRRRSRPGRRAAGQARALDQQARGTACCAWWALLPPEDGAVVMAALGGGGKGQTGCQRATRPRSHGRPARSDALKAVCDPRPGGRPRRPGRAIRGAGPGWWSTWTWAC